MRFEERSPADLAGADLRAPRLQATPAWLDFVAPFLPALAGPGARLSALVAFDGARPLAAIPLLRTSPLPTPRPFPLDLVDLFFGTWIRAVPFTDRRLWLRARASVAFGAALTAANPSLRRALVIHAPLSPASLPAVAPDSPAAAIPALLAEARALAAREGRCALLPRVLRETWGGLPDGWIEVPSYSVGAISLDQATPARTRQMIRRNTRLLDHLGVCVEVSSSAPPDVPFARLFAGTAGRHRDPAPALDDAFFRALAARFPEAVRFLSARAGRVPLGFLAALRHGASWEAFKCGTDRVLAGRAPVYLDLVYGRLPALAARQGAARVELGPGDLHVKRRYGARVEPVSAFVALPPGFRGRAAFTAYLAAVGAGLQVASEATTPK